MKLLYGTGNPAKAAAMQNRIAGLGIELISLQDLRSLKYVIISSWDAKS